MTNPDFAEDIAAIASIDAVDKILEVICKTTGLGFSAVARVTDTRWVACAVRDQIEFGLRPGGELDLKTTICHDIRALGHSVAIDHVSESAEYCDHHTPRMYGFQSYISVPIKLRDGTIFGTLCAIDPNPAKVNNAVTVKMFKLFADLIATHLDSQERVVASETALTGERESSKLREQFIAVLGHDLRNPLASIDFAAQLLLKKTSDEDDKEVLQVMRRSVKRMTGLIDDVLDFARGRLGGGIGVYPASDTNLEETVTQVVAELQTAWPARQIHTEIAIDGPSLADNARIAQMVSNLLGNALSHGDPASTVWVRAQTDADNLTISVTNHGETIPDHVIEDLFEPFARGKAKENGEGLGLGLYIAGEIARAHKGTLKVSSVAGETCFTFQMPRVQP